MKGEKVKKKKIIRERKITAVRRKQKKNDGKGKEK